MSFCNYIQCFFVFQFLFTIGCHGNRNHALLVTKNDNHFELKIPERLEQDIMMAVFQITVNEEAYSYCPEPIGKRFFGKVNINVLEPGEKLKFKTINDTQKCYFAIHPSLLKVTNPEELKKNWNNNFELFHSGFLLYTEEIKKDKTSKNSAPKYEELDDNNYDLVLGIEIHFNKEIQQTTAVEYTLLSASVFQEQNIYDFEKVSPYELTPPFEKYHKHENDKQFLEEKTGTDSRKYLGQLRVVGNMIIAVPFASPEHFQLMVWKKSAQIWANQTPMWLNVCKTISRAVTFTRFIAKHLGKLKVATGITGIMSLLDEKHESEDHPRSVDGMKSNDNYVLLEDKDTNFRMANYYWSAYEYYDGKEWFGVFVVLHCNPFLDITVDICKDVCDKNGWIISNSDFKRGKMYCCEMTEEVINKLEANFLTSRGRKVFDLNNWPNVKTLIYKDFEPFKTL